MIRLRLKGFSLIELMIGLTLGSILVALGMKAFSSLTNSQRNQTAALESTGRAQEVALYFRSRFNGTKSFNNLKFHVPGTTFKSIGPGIYVDSSGVNSTSDSLFIVSNIGKAFTLPVGSVFAPVASSPNTQLTFNPAASILALPTAGNYHVISRIQQSDITKLQSLNTTPNPAAPSGPPLVNSLNYVTDSNTDSSSPTYSPTTNFQLVYAAGDSVSKAEITKIWLEGGNLTAQDFSTPNTRVLAPSITSFTVKFKNTSTPAICSASSPTNSFDHDWTKLATPDCYQYLTSIEIKYTLSDRIYNLEFQVN